MRLIALTIFLSIVKKTRLFQARFAEHTFKRQQI